MINVKDAEGIPVIYKPTNGPDQIVGRVLKADQLSNGDVTVTMEIDKAHLVPAMPSSISIGTR